MAVKMADLDEFSKLDFDHYQAKLEELSSTGFALADPLKMTYLQGLAKRLSRKENSNNHVLINKAVSYTHLTLPTICSV